MTKEEFIRKLKNISESVILVDDLEMNPIEIVLITKSKRKIAPLLDDNKRFMVRDKELYRVVKIVTFREIGIKQERLINHSFPEFNSTNIHLLEPQALRMFMVYYACILSERENWLSQNVIRTMASRQKNTDRTMLFNQVNAYLKDEGIKLKRIGNNQTLTVFRENCSGMVWINHKLMFAWRKMKREFVFRWEAKKNAIYKRLTKQKFIKKMINQGYFGNHWNELQYISSSGCDFFHIWENGQSIFLKGNTHSRYGGVSNEICAQRVLCENNNNCLFFLPMLRYGEKKDWISFAYMEAPSLKEFLLKRHLTDKELEMLGNFLIQMLDVLNECGIVHNDLRLENIMVGVDLNNQIQEFKIVDFGCSSVNNALPWSNERIIGRVYSEGVCGNNRYNHWIVDDAASAALVYCQAGGKDEQCVNQIRRRIGRRYTCFFTKG